MPPRKPAAPLPGPSLELEPAVAHRGDQVEIRGEGFGVRRAVQLLVDHMPVERFRSTPRGRIARGFVVPADWLPGTHLVVASSTVGGARALLTLRNQDRG